MTTAPALPTADAPVKASVDVRLKAVSDAAQPLPVGQLLAWGDSHADPEVQDQAARARAALAGLRKRHAADQELTAITTETEQLEKRLAELRAREAELAPAKPKTRRKPAAYPAAEVRAWAKENGVDCPPVGRVPKTVVDAWREATGTAA
ncbi:Lsr2 family DNA-binding protein [Streptomyces dubilierae]|uniref:Histone-like nucleoid-structuring protein Lsr2 n=1 Tax=Streptomyces dubilierae TaxID=3075533 RepID=A0ABU2P6S9_9ACTN|nr:histone-like nucleoid-structuring protein Lsr2 [Streptomyces sp. DSM 41921]MDT0387861.1 histone-like nucleoid-structuring protein Lsr2 [Streptomyces sp. DSM 41921]